MTHECTPESCDGHPASQDVAMEEELNSLRRKSGIDERLASVTKTFLYHRIEKLQAHIELKNRQLKAAQDRLDLLDALEAVGVNNWDGYSEAWRLLEGDDDEDA